MPLWTRMGKRGGGASGLLCPRTEEEWLAMMSQVFVFSQHWSVTFFKFSPDSTFGGWHLFGLGWTLHGLQGVIVWQTRCWIEIRFSVEGVEFCIWWHSICREIFCEFRFQISRGAFFVWRAPMLSWPRIMCSQVSLLKFLEPSQEMPLILSEGKKTALDCP